MMILSRPSFEMKRVHHIVYLLFGIVIFLTYVVYAMPVIKNTTSLFGVGLIPHSAFRVPFYHIWYNLWYKTLVSWGAFCYNTAKRYDNNGVCRTHRGGVMTIRHGWRPWVAMLVLVGLMMATGAYASAAPAQQTASRYFAQTGQTVSGGFLAYFDRYGGIGVFGYPITAEIVEGGETVQYFQRARMEWHPNNPAAYQVQLGLLGTQLHGEAAPRVARLASSSSLRVRYFNETGHNVTNVFLDFWSRNGGVDILGYPLGEAFTRDGVTYQWFQRARLEYRNRRVELGLLGTEVRNGGSNTPIPAAPLPADTVRRRQFPETGQTVQGAFLDYWEQRGGMARFGYPISGEFTDGGKTIQYFEYARFEYASGQVQLGLLGSELHGVEPPVNNFAPPWNTNFRYFPETGHNVTNAFLRYFQSNGGVEMFGYPITEAYSEGGATVQWFQRRKLIFTDVVREEALGRTRFNPDSEGRFAPQQIFLRLVTDNPTIASKLGTGLEDAQNPTIAHQPFENGQMLWRSDTNQIYVLFNDGSWQVYDNPWRPGEPASANLTPPADRFEPLLGFGEVWRSLGSAGGKLGWATDAQYDGRGTAQRFQFGALIYNPVNDRLYTMFAGQNWADVANLYPDFTPAQR